MVIMKIELPFTGIKFNIPVPPVDNFQQANQINARAKAKIEKVKKEQLLAQSYVPFTEPTDFEKIISE